MIMPSSAAVHDHRQRWTATYRRFTVALVMPGMVGTALVCSSTLLVRRWRPIPTGLSTLRTTVEEIFTGEEVLAGTFSLNEHPVIILFYSGASHDFISSTCAKKAMLSMVAMETPYMISTPRGRVDADRIVHKAPLELAGRVFNTDLIILKGQDLDVILGMSWMKWHGAVLDIAGRLVHLHSPVYSKVIVPLPAISRIKASLHHVAELKLEDILVV
jgi:hypothetical protein